MTCKTRKAALRGERSKLHYYLLNTTTHMFESCNPLSELEVAILIEFEVRIDWSTWGRSR